MPCYCLPQSGPPAGPQPPNCTGNRLLFLHLLRRSDAGLVPGGLYRSGVVELAGPRSTSPMATTSAEMARHRCILGHRIFLLQLARCLLQLPVIGEIRRVNSAPRGLHHSGRCCSFRSPLGPPRLALSISCAGRCVRSEVGISRKRLLVLAIDSSKRAKSHQRQHTSRDGVDLSARCTLNARPSAKCSHLPLA